MKKNALPVFVEQFEAQNNIIEATIETQTYSTELTTCLFLNTTTSPMTMRVLNRYTDLPIQSLLRNTIKEICPLWQRSSDGGMR